MEKDSKTFGTLEVSNETWKMRCSGKQPFTLQKIPKPRVQRRRAGERVLLQTKQKLSKIIFGTQPLSPTVTI